MKRIRTTGEYSLADGNASPSQKMVLSTKASQWTSFLARHSSVLGAFDEIDINLKSVPIVTSSVDKTLTVDNVGITYRSVSGGDSPVVFTLPAISTMGGGAYFRFLRGTEDIAVRAASGEDILMPWGAQTGTDNGIFCDFGLGEILLVCDGTQWIPISGIGEWHDNGSGLPPREFVRFSAEVSDGAFGELVIVDPVGRMITSRLAYERLLLTQNIPDGKNSSTTIGVDESGRHVITQSGGDDPVVLTLPTIGSGPGVYEAGSMFTFMVGPVSLEILPNTAQYIDMPWGAVTPSDKVRCDDEGGVLKLVQYTDQSFNCRWRVVYGVGEWYLSTDSTKRHHFDGNVVGATEGHVVAFDVEGNIKDSGMAILGSMGVVMSSDYYATASDNGKMLIVLTANTVYLPEAPEQGTLIGVMHSGDASHEIEVAPQGSDVISIPGHSTSGVNVESWKTSKLMSHCWFAYGGGAWFMWDGSGEWEGDDDDPSPTTYKYNWDGNVEGATEDNFVLFDVDGNIKDGASFGTGSGDVCEGNDLRLSDARTPTQHAIDSSTLHSGVSGATEDNLVSFDANGLPKDSGHVVGVFPIQNVTTSATLSDPGKTYVYTGSSDGTLTLDLPDGGICRIVNGGGAGVPKLSAGTISLMSGPSGMGGTLDAVDTHSSIVLSHAGSGDYYVLSGTGVWQDVGLGTVFNFDGFLSGATGGNFVTFDGLGNISDGPGFGTGSGDVCEGDDSRLSDARTPTAHASTHLSGGTDELEYRGEVFLPIADAKDYSEDEPAVLENLIDSPAVLPIRKFDPTTQEETSFLWEVPADIVAADGIKVTVVGAISEATAPASGEGVVFKVSGYCVGHGNQLGGTFGTAQASKDADLNASGADTQKDRFQLSQSAAIMVTDLAAGELAILNLYRDVADSDDDYGQDVGVSGIRIQYNKKPIAGW